MCASVRVELQFALFLNTVLHAHKTTKNQIMILTANPAAPCSAYSRPHAHAHHALLKRSHRRCNTTHTPSHTSPLSCSAHTRDLWDYQGSCVQQFNLETFRFMHKLSYGHRNRRTFVVVLYDPSMPSCQDIEYEVRAER